MVQATPFLLVLFLALGAHGLSAKKVQSGWDAQGRVGCTGGCGCRLCCGTSAEFSPLQCNLVGRWVNDLGSNMTITSVNANGAFGGSYHTAVTATSNEIKVSPLQGSMQKSPNQKGQPTFGFTVNWKFSESVTVFTGQCFVDDDGKEVLKTMWLLRSHVEDIKNDWKATR
ncbi:AVID protein, partial [Chaetops frenatus]|nr:AVID protein [Chaetops frenatus]